MKTSLLVIVSCVSVLLISACGGGSNAALFPTSEDGRSGYINADGKVVIPLEFKSAEAFSEGLAAVKVAEKGWGYIDSAGRMVIEPQFTDANEFDDGMAVVNTRGGYAFIDPTGTVVLRGGKGTPDDLTERKFTSVSSFSEGFAMVGFGHMAIDFSSGTLTGEAEQTYMDKTGVLLTSPDFDIGSLPFSEGLAAVNFHGTYGFIDTEGEFAIEPRFERAYSFDGGLAPTKVGGKWGFIDTGGNFVIEPNFDDALSFSEGFAAVAVDNAWGFIDAGGNLVIGCQFEEGSRFSQERAAVKLDGKWGYLDADGNMVVHPAFDSANEFEDGLAAVRVEGGRRYIDRAGAWVWNPSGSVG